MTANYARLDKPQQDRRFGRLQLTPEGQAFIEDVFPIHAARITELMGGLEPEQLQQLGYLTRTLGRAVDAASTD